MRAFSELVSAALKYDGTRHFKHIFPSFGARTISHEISASIATFQRKITITCFGNSHLYMSNLSRLCKEKRIELSVRKFNGEVLPLFWREVYHAVVLGVLT